MNIIASKQINLLKVLPYSFRVFRMLHNDDYSLTAPSFLRAGHCTIDIVIESTV